MITVTEHQKTEWSRMAQDAYRNNRNDIGHRFSGAAALPRNAAIRVDLYDDLMHTYRAWLIDGLASI